MLAPITVRLPKEISERIVALQAKRLDRPDKSQIIRELLAMALECQDRAHAR